MCSKHNISLGAQNTCIILEAIVNMIGGGPISPLNKHGKLYFNYKDIYMRSQNYEANGYRRSMDLLIIFNKTLLCL